MIITDIVTAFFEPSGSRHRLIAKGRVMTGGYSNERLKPDAKATTKNTLAFRFEADAPTGIVTDVVTILTAAIDISLTADVSSIVIFGDKANPFVIIRVPADRAPKDKALISWAAHLGNDGPIDPVPWPWLWEPKSTAPLGCDSCPYPWNAIIGSAPPPPPLPDLTGYKLRVVLPGHVVDQRYDPARLTIFISADGRILSWGLY